MPNRFYPEADDTPKDSDLRLPSSYLSFIAQAKGEERQKREAFAKVMFKWAQYHHRDQNAAEVGVYWSAFKHRTATEIDRAFDSATDYEKFWPMKSVLRSYLPSLSESEPTNLSKQPLTPEEEVRRSRHMGYCKWAIAHKKRHPDYESNGDDMKEFVRVGKLSAAYLKKREAEEA